jgi:outer membrane protein assembly factor BamA
VQERPTRIAIVDGELRIESWAWTIADSPFLVQGRAALTGDQPLDARIDGTIDLRLLGAFLPGGSTGGIGEVSATVGGTVGAPVAEGVVQLRGAELMLADPQIGMSNVNGRVVLSRNRIEVTGVQGDVNGGSLSILGELEYQGLEVTGGTLSIESRGVALDVPEGMQTEIDAALAVAFGGRIQVSGRVDVVRGAYREPLSLAAGLAAATRDSAAAAPVGAATLLDAIDLNIAVSSAGDLIVDNNYGRMDIGLDVRLVGTAAQPGIVGRANIREGGTLFLGGRSYLIERGVIDFTDPRAIVPDLDLAARTRLRGPDESGAGIEYDIRVEIVGTPETLDATLSSEPARSQADIVSLLATGRLADQAGGIGGGAATEQAIALLSGEALGFAAQAIGVDSIRLERDPALDPFAADPAIAAEVDPAQRLTVSRRLADVEVMLSQNLRETGLLTWIVAYSPIRAVEVRTVSRDDRSRSYELRHDLALGSPPGPIVRAATQEPRVADVRLTGDIRYPAEVVRQLLRVGTGDRFDFYRWQEDRDRLRRFYLDRGHLDVRVAARRSDVPGEFGRDAVVLEYDVAAGPMARLEIEGYTLPNQVLDDLERVWQDTIVEVALVDGLAEAVRQHLAGEGYLRSDVDVRRLPSAEGERAVQIAIVPGPRFRARRIEAVGNRIFTTDQIVSMADGLGIDAWLTPRLLAEDIALAYRQSGYLAAAVTAGPVQFSGDEALLPVEITEGEPFAVSRVLVSGIEARSEAAVRDELGISPGSLYTPAAVQAARTAVNRAYDKDGFNTMTSRLDVERDLDTATVEVRLTIDEGPRQVLESVRVIGARDVRPHVVEDALNLEEGEAADLESWYAGRRRLFRTGLFQRVDVEAVPVENAATPGVEPVRAEVTLVRRAPWRVRYGVDVTDESAPLADEGRVFGGGVSANIERFGLIGRPGTLGVGLRFNNDQRIARGFISLPSLFGLPIESRLFASRTRDLIQGENVLSAIEDRTAFTAEQRLPLADLEVAFGYQIERNHAFDPSANPDDPFALDTRVQAARLTGTIVFDTRSDAFEPARGFFHSSAFEYAPEILGSDVRFAKYSLQQFLFAELAPGLVSASAVRLGIGRGFGGQRLPVFEQFLAGGATTVRGYPADALGGYDFFGDPIGGDAVLVLNQELRFPIFSWLGGVAFVDAGEVFETAGDVLSVGTLDVGAGAGVRFRTPVGLFRLDVATPVPARDRSFKWYFAFGHPF